MKSIIIKCLAALFLITTSFGKLFSQETKMSLTFSVEDAVKKCNVLVKAHDTAVKEVEVKLYVKRLYSLLPIGKPVATDENGIATFEFPNDIPQDLDGKLMVIAKVEDPAAETSKEVNWGVPRAVVQPLERSLAASREKAPYYLMIVSNLIIIGIWGTLIYVVREVYRKRKPNYSK
jgi:hypothetical protein